MENGKERGNGEKTDQDDRGLSWELESLYHRVARLDQPDGPVREGPDTGENGGESVESPRRTAPSPNPPRCEELTAKWTAIRDAYERLLTYWPFAPEHPPDPPDQ